QFRVQMSPRIMNVAVASSQHSPMLGQCASSQTEWRFHSRSRLLRRMWLGPPGARTLSHAGLRPSGMRLEGWITGSAYVMSSYSVHSNQIIMPYGSSTRTGEATGRDQRRDEPTALAMNCSTL